jgi:hypothetical protein
VGLVGRAKAESSADGDGEDGSTDIAALIRQAVAKEMERQRLLSLEASKSSDSD